MARRALASLWRHLPPPHKGQNKRRQSAWLFAKNTQRNFDVAWTEGAASLLFPTMMGWYVEYFTMTRYWFICLLLGSISWSQTTTSTSAPPTEITATADTAAHDLSNGSKTSRVGPDRPLITIAGLCDNSSDDKTTTPNCKTVITQGQFERVIEAVQPGMPARGRREFAERYADALVMARKAEQMGLDKGPNYQEQIELARIQVLSQNLKRLIQEEASQISDKEIEDYYRDKPAKFERAEIDRIYIPRVQQLLQISGGKDMDANSQIRQQESEQTMKKEADSLWTRAIAGEDFSNLQADAYRMAGIKSALPNTSMVIRRISLPPNQSSVMDLKPGEISSVLTDSNGYFIYRIKNKTVLPLNQVRDEVTATLRSQHMEEKMRAIHDSATPILDESYFAP